APPCGCEAGFDGVGANRGGSIQPIVAAAANMRTSVRFRIEECRFICQIPLKLRILAISIASHTLNFNGRCAGSYWMWAASSCGHVNGLCAALRESCPGLTGECLWHIIEAVGEDSRLQRVANESSEGAVCVETVLVVAVLSNHFWSVRCDEANEQGG
ncbi:MAG: hypothetical protein ABIH46_02220, partial [Chloroflexota bacterium]